MTMEMFMRENLARDPRRAKEIIVTLMGIPMRESGRMI